MKQALILSALFLCMANVSQAAPKAAQTHATPKVTPAKVNAVVYKSPTCGCCSKWETHLRKNGFAVESKPTEDMDQVKLEQKVPQELQSCHTAVISGYVIEGHVPAAAIRKLLKEMPAGVKGLAVAGMPTGSPGMEGPHPEKYKVMAFGAPGGPTIFAEY